MNLPGALLDFVNDSFIFCQSYGAISQTVLYRVRNIMLCLLSVCYGKIQNRSLSCFKMYFIQQIRNLLIRVCSQSYSLLGPKMRVSVFKNIVTNKKIQKNQQQHLFVNHQKLQVIVLLCRLFVHLYLCNTAFHYFSTQMVHQRHTQVSFQH